MEYLEGSDLSHVLAGYRACAPERALRIALQLCGALGSAHSVGIVHRDVKPANIFLVEHDGGEVAKLLDFGVARPGPTTSSGISGPGRFVGTPGYAAPEQAVSGTCDHRADIYSLGAVLYEMLTGTPVFSGDSTKSIVTMQLLDDPEPPSRRAPHLGLPAELDRVVLRALARRPEDRYATMRQLATALRASEPQRA
jgi:serine/threonine-protein kinase